MAEEEDFRVGDYGVGDLGFLSPPPPQEAFQLQPQIWREVSPLHIVGVTRAGVSNSFVFPQWGLCFDVGQGFSFNVSSKIYFISHGHMDHASGIPYILSQKSHEVGKGRSKDFPLGPLFYLPQSLIAPMKEIVSLWEKIERPSRGGFCFDFRPIEALEPIILPSLVPASLSVRPFPVAHRLDGSFGFTLFQGESPLWTYSGDTEIDFLDGAPWVTSSKVLFCECTKLGLDGPVVEAKKWRHTHLEEILDALPRFQGRGCERIVLIHISKRYSYERAQELLAEALQRRGWKSQETLREEGFPTLEIFPFSSGL